MTEQTQPTDAEIEAIWSAVSTSSIWPEYEDLLAFARAVLAKWGTPAGAGEPQPSSEGPPEVWLQLHCDCPPHERTEPVDYTGGDVTWCWHAIHSDDVRYVRADLATTPQPTQAQAGAVPLTDEQIEEIAKQFITRVGSHWEHDDAIPDNGRIEDFVRAIEHAHGIKGADHG